MIEAPPKILVLDEGSFDGWPIEDFAMSIGARSLAMLTAYLDDTGTHDGSKVVGVLGVLTHNLHWARIEFDWKKKLKAGGISYFHAVDCEQAQREFERMERPERDRLWRNLLGVLSGHPAMIVGSAIVRDDWNALPADVKTWFRDDPAYFCYEHCMQQISQWSKDHASSHPVAIVFAEQKRLQGVAAKLHDYYQRSAYFDNLGSFSTAKPQCVIPLQPADLVAYESYRHMVGKLKGAEQGWKVAEIVGSGIPNISRFHDSETLARMLEAGPKTFGEAMTASSATARSF